jgi:hypothetical protein
LDEESEIATGPLTVRGIVFDEMGEPVEGASVTIRSLDQSMPFEAEAVTATTGYHVSSVPQGVVMEHIATKDGWTTRRQVRSHDRVISRVNFGRLGGTGVGNGAAYFISDFPEIVEVTPADGATGAHNYELTYKFTFSEPLSADGRDRFVHAFRIVPNNAQALGFEPNIDLTASDNYDVSDGLSLGQVASTTYGYELKRGNQFLSNESVQVVAIWNAEGTEMTASFNAPLKTGDTYGGQYAVMLVTNNGQRIEDLQGKQLGTTADSMVSYPIAASHLFNVFRTPELSVSDDFTGEFFGLDVGLANWAQTHKSAVKFTVERDDKAPVLQSVHSSQSGDDHRIDLTFDEPMAVFGGDGVGLYGGNEVFDLSKYSFAVSNDRGKTSAVRLDVVAPTYNVIASMSGGNLITALEPAGGGPRLSTFPPEQAFRLAATNVATGAAAYNSLVAGQIGIAVMGADPRRLFLKIGKGQSLAFGLKEIKGRVAGIVDPAGNEITGTDADANVRTGSVD